MNSTGEVVVADMITVYSDTVLPSKVRECNTVKIATSINCLTSYLIQSDTGTKSGVHLGKVATLSEGQHRERESAILKHIFGLSEEVRVKFILAYSVGNSTEKYMSRLWLVLQAKNANHR